MNCAGAPLAALVVGVAVLATVAATLDVAAAMFVDAALAEAALAEVEPALADVTTEPSVADAVASVEVLSFEPAILLAAQAVRPVAAAQPRKVRRDKEEDTPTVNHEREP
jgi:hypothetical protein